MAQKLKFNDRSWQIQCDMVTNGQEALTKLISAADKNEPYSIALVDCMMPVMDGIELSKRILADNNLSATNVIMITSIGLPISFAEFKKMNFWC